MDIPSPALSAPKKRGRPPKNRTLTDLSFESSPIATDTPKKQKTRTDKKSTPVRSLNDESQQDDSADEQLTLLGSSLDDLNAAGPLMSLSSQPMLDDTPRRFAARSEKQKILSYAEEVSDPEDRVKTPKIARDAKTPRSGTSKKLTGQVPHRMCVAHQDIFDTPGCWRIPRSTLSPLNRSFADMYLNGQGICPDIPTAYTLSAPDDPQRQPVVLIHPFESAQVSESGDCLINAGGSIWSTATLSLQDNYIAIGVRQRGKQHLVGHKYCGPGVIQIWKSCAKETKFLFCIAHDHGFILDMCWAPFNTETIPQQSETDVPIVGWITVAFSDGEVCIYPVPSEDILSGEVGTECGVPVFKLEPSWKSRTVDAVNYSIRWSPQHGASILAGGGSDGFVTIWNVCSFYSNSAVKPSDERTILGYYLYRFRALDSAVRALAFHPMQPNTLAVGGNDSELKIWDIRDQAQPVMSVLTGWITSAVWKLGAGPVYAAEEENVRTVEFLTQRTTSLNDQSSDVWCVDEDHKMLVSCGANGVVTMMSNQRKKMRNAKLRVVLHRMAIAGDRQNPSDSSQLVYSVNPKPYRENWAAWSKGNGEHFPNEVCLQSCRVNYTPEHYVVVVGGYNGLARVQYLSQSVV
eukprot:TRINITY_DN5896_c0_g1_i1.p1 TRINITY_DN5896_c0_g1~~TRINITY_DN5896_c0_g1_i1.p1  ORF type:complete len:632 (+),score=104.02 TRINITY_DN5896_c0_g1_i1:23-1918(+)